jgi:branched-chain amino acid transport system ATP-binding protein
MMLAAQAQSGESMWKALLNGWRPQEQGVEERALKILDEFNMTHMKDEFAGALSGGQRKLLEMARAMMAEPRLIMLDEPMAGVNPALTQSLLGHVKRLRSEGISVMFVEHDMDVVQDISCGRRRVSRVVARGSDRRDQRGCRRATGIGGRGRRFRRRG